MSLGPHEFDVAEAVQLFRDIASSTAFPSGPSPDIGTLNDACKAAWENTYGEEEFTWSDLRSLTMRRIHQAGYATEGYPLIEASLSKQMDELSRALIKRFRGDADEALGEDVISDMHHVLRARAVGGRSGGFAEQMIEAYREGYWPCGWVGEFPEGRPLTYARQP